MTKTRNEEVLLVPMFWDMFITPYVTGRRSRVLFPSHDLLATASAFSDCEGVHPEHRSGLRGYLDSHNDCTEFLASCGLTELLD